MTRLIHFAALIATPMHSYASRRLQHYHLFFLPSFLSLPLPPSLSLSLFPSFFLHFQLQLCSNCDSKQWKAVCFCDILLILLNTNSISLSLSL